MLIERVTTIDAAPAAVWDLLIDPERVQEWMPGVVSYETDPPGQGPGVGTTSIMKAKEGSKVVEYMTEILTWEPTDRLVVDIRGGSLGPNPMQVTYELAPAGSKTTLTYRGEWQAGGLMMRLMVPLIRWMAGRNASQAMARLGTVVSRSQAAS